MSNDITLSGSNLTMSSLEIAELTGKRHDHVIRDIEVILENVGINPPKFGAVYKDAKGEERKCYNLPKRESILVVTKYSDKARLAVIDRWLQLETNARDQALYNNTEMTIEVYNEVLALKKELSSMKKNVVDPKREAKKTIFGERLFFGYIDKKLYGDFLDVMKNFEKRLKVTFRMGGTKREQFKESLFIEAKMPRPKNENDLTDSEFRQLIDNYKRLHIRR